MTVGRERAPVIAVAYTHPTGGMERTVRVHPTSASVFGRLEDAWADPTLWSATLHPDDWEAVGSAFGAPTAFRAGSVAMEYRVVGETGEVFWVQDRAMFEPGDQDPEDPGAWIGVMVDITESKEMEGRLREAETRYRSLVEQIPAITYVDLADEAMTTTYISPQIEWLLGVLPQEYMDDPDLWYEMLHPDDRQRALEQYLEGRASGRPFAIEYRLIGRDGRVVWFRDEAMVLRDAMGRPSLVQGVMLDVTEAKRADEALRRSEQRYRDLVEHAQDIVFTLGPDATITSLNPAFETITGWSREEWVGRSFPPLVHPDDLGTAFDALKKIAAGRSVGAFELRILRPDGGFQVGEFSLTPQPEDGRVVGALGITRDITQRKLAEAELEAAREAAEEANRAKSEFLANMSHEIRTPLNAVIGLSDLLLDTTLDDEQRDYLETVRSSGDALLDVINDILDFSKIEAGRLEVEHAPFDLRACVEESLDLVTSAAAAKGIEIAYLIDQHVPPVLVGDVTRLRQVLVNLLSNAVKFTGAGEVVVTVSSRPRDERRHDVHFAVIDTGIGIPPEKMDRLFDSFSQVDASVTRRYGGTGLGLAISKRLSEIMGGGMWAESTLGAGSTFHFTVLAEIGPELPRRELEGAHLAGLRVLVVDDSATNRLILSKQLRSWDVTPVEAASAEEALELLRAERFDAAVLDMIMPIMDGQSLGEVIRETPEAAVLPLVMLTSLGRHRDGRVDGEPFAAYLTKPVKPSRLRDVLAQVITSPRPSARAAEAEGAPAAASARPDPELGARHPLRILLAEDNVVNQKVAVKLLERMGYAPALAANGTEVLRALEQEPYDVVLMDVAMPEMDGLETTRRIRRELPEGRRPRIVAMTANAMAGDRERCFEAGMDDYVGKPIDAKALATALRRSPRLGIDAAPNSRATEAAAAPGRVHGPAGAPADARATTPAGSASTPPGPASDEDGAPAVDPSALDSFARELGGAAAEVVAEIVETFLSDAPTLIGQMREAVRTSNPIVLDRASHTLKSSSATVGALVLSARCRAIEEEARAGHATGLGEAVEAVEREYERVRRELEAGIAA
jgi:PAS domain S-box-containing protein